MNKRLERLRENIVSGKYVKCRKPAIDRSEIINACKNLSQYEACNEVLQYYLSREDPVIIKGANFAFQNSFTYRLYPMILSGVDMSLTGNGHPVNGSFVKNLSPNWKNLLKRGLRGIISDIDGKIESRKYSANQLMYLQNTRKILNGVVCLQHRYLQAAVKANEKTLAKVLSRVPYEQPSTFHEALQSVYFIFNMIRVSQSNHIGFHRIDQYLLPFYENDVRSGVLTRRHALDLIEEFFLMLNIDTDLYSAIQPGDSGMTVMLGGKDMRGNDVSNELTGMFLTASAEVGMLEPKINLRVHSGTPQDLLDLSAELTHKGLGYPQYCNDDVIIPGLLKFGYKKEDAYDYTVAACWEFVVGNGMDTPNALYLNMPLAVDRCIRKALKQNSSWERLLRSIPSEFKRMIKQQFASKKIHTRIPNLLFSALEPDCIENMTDSMRLPKWHYFYGCHGVGSSTAVDSLMNVRKFIYERKSVKKNELLAALENNWAGFSGLRDEFVRCGDKLCNNSSEADELLEYLFKSFADVLGGLSLNGRRIRPGTGSAQFYAVLTQGSDPELKATADGRRINDYVSSSLAPSPYAKVNGILSVFQSYRHIDYLRICNGGPITTEVTEDFFKNSVTKRKFTQIIRSFVKSGCQQLQINLLNRARLIDAQRRPELYKNLIVRVWGWSGYFVQLDKKFQDQIIGRHVYR